MVRIAISSDNHLDVNQVDPAAALAMQAQYLQDHSVQYYFYAGDLFNDFTQTRQYMTDLQHRLADRVHVYYIAGNHDLLQYASYDQIEHLSAPGYLHRHYVDLPGTNWRMIGNNGWYDYSFSTYRDDSIAVRQWKRVYWLDSEIEQPGDDQERMNNVLSQVTAQLAAAKDAGKRVLFLTHFAPRHELLAPRPAGVNTPRRERFYQMITAMMGSDRLGDLLESTGNVKYAFYGHLHGIHPPLEHNGVTYLNQAVGVRNKRINEWQQDDFTAQWQSSLRILDL
ncbi:MAG: metallophosphoesterase [Lactobacillaceae bacterium]|uniref:metallophosphoesterase n=1 Tax=Limosilactobacillus sp. TaxID=2773925 RepID=UPI002A765750|nr:metallophosphoesterase [Limosilactobacillus sp.]MDD7693327.1 metallophosphoesterase [Lactobacillaceae bacterium]MDY2803184.1 metallophosphoesterase [Limosilactobacillus sp.]